MPTKVVRAALAEHYQWGGPAGDSADGWFLVKGADMHVIEEEMPAGISETRHLHNRARQFFFVLEGELAMEVEGERFLVSRGEGIEIAPGQAHQAANRGAVPVRFLVMSCPPSHGDRINRP